MVLTKQMNIRIEAISCAVPENAETLDKYRSIFGDDTVDKFGKMTGVKERRITDKTQTTSDLAYEAACDLIAKNDINVDEIGILIFVSQTPDYFLPATACVLGSRLELSKDCVTFDMNLGCSGYVNGINVIASIMQSSNISKGLLLVGDTITKVVAPEDRASCMLFGDAGAATLLVKDENEEHGISGTFRTDGDRADAIIIPAGAFRNRDADAVMTEQSDGNMRSDYNLYMNGTDVFSFTISDVPALLNEYFVETGKSCDDYDSFVFHQANEYILKQAAKKTKLPMEKLPLSIHEFGNTSVASIPLTLCHTYGDTEVQEISAILYGFGVGLNWGLVDIKLNTAKIFPIIETNKCFEDGTEKVE